VDGHAVIAAAVGFGSGCLIAGGQPPAAFLGWGFLLAAGPPFLVGRRLGRRRRRGSSALLASAGLGGPGRVEPGPRERILAAAGFPGPVAGTRRSAVTMALWTLSALLAGTGWTLVRAPRSLEAWTGRFVAITGTAASDIRALDYGWGGEIAVDRAVVAGRVIPARPKVWVSGSGPMPAIAAGQSVAGAGTLEALPRPAEDFDAYLLSRGVTATIQAIRLTAEGPPANPAFRVANAVRDAFRRGSELSLPARDAGLLLGLAIGDTEQMDLEVEEDFRATGLTHLLAVSGSNVALVVIPVLAVTARLGAGRTGRVAAATAMLGLFALVTRWEPSVLRATAMAVIGLSAMWAGRPRRAGPALALAVLALLVADPLLATSVGFQLSVGATIGLVAMAGPLAARLSFLPRPVAAAAAATVAAQAAVTPLLLLLFGTVPTVTLLANVVAFPAVPPALFLGGAAAGAGLVGPGPGEAIGRLASMPLGYLAAVADRLARFPLPSATGGVMAAGVAAALAAILALSVRLGRGRRLSVVLAVVAAAVAWASVPSAGPPPSLTVTFLDVGQGDAAVVRTPEGATLLIDAGPDPHLVATKLAALGVRRLDLAIASHSHADHVTGFPAVLARFPVGTFLEPGCPSDTPPYRRFRRSLRDEAIPIRHPRGGQRLLVGLLEIRVLNPERCSPGGTSPNDESLVLRLAYGQATVLFTGDAEVPAQRDMLTDGDPIRTTVLKVPHQGGDTSDPAFLEATGATVGVVSVGPNEYGHPNPEVLGRLRDQGMVLYRTDRAGDVTVTFAPDGSPVVASSL
jgi:competence protein ComEC